MEPTYWTRATHMRRRRLLRAGALGAGSAVAAWLAACRGTTSSESGQVSVATTSKGADAAAGDTSGSGGVLTVAMSAGNVPYPNTPPSEGGEGFRFVGFQIYDGLTRFNFDQGDTVPSPNPGLAEKWSVDADKLTWTFSLRKGVKFHDGTDFDAEAVVFNLDRIIKKDHPLFDQGLYAASTARTGTIDSYRAVDPGTLEIKTKLPFSFLPWDMGSTLIASPTAAKKWGVKEYVNHPVGTGPFRSEKYIDGQVLEMTPNRDYWGPKAKLDRLIVRPMPEPATRLAALQSGEVLWAEVPPPDSKKQLEAAGFNVVLKQYPHAIRIDYNVADKPFDDIRVRQALQYAVDRQAMCGSLLGGLCVPSTQLMYKGHPWYEEMAGDTYVHDPRKAKQMLADAGYPNGFKMTIAYPTGGSGNMWPGPMMELLQRDLKNVGVDAELAPLEWNTILTIYRAGLFTPENRKYNALFFSPNTGTPPALLNYLSNRIQPAGCCNVWGYKSAEVDRLLLASQTEFEPATSDALIRQAMGAMAKDAPSIFLVHDLNFRVLSPKVRGFVQSQSWWADLRSVWVKS